MSTSLYQQVFTLLRVFGFESPRGRSGDPCPDSWSVRILPEVLEGLREVVGVLQEIVEVPHGGLRDLIDPY